MDETFSDALARSKTAERLAEIVDNMSTGYLAVLLALESIGSVWRDANRTWEPPEFGASGSNSPPAPFGRLSSSWHF